MPPKTNNRLKTTTWAKTTHSDHSGQEASTLNRPRASARSLDPTIRTDPLQALLAEFLLSTSTSVARTAKLIMRFTETDLIKSAEEWTEEYELLPHH